MKLNWKDFLAVAIGLVALAGLVIMFNSEGSVVLQNAAGTPGQIVKDFNANILPAIQQYSLAIGAILFAVSISYILLGSQDDISTSPSEPDSKK